jgi:hypothetical protein
LQPSLKQTAGLQGLGEESQLPHGCGFALGVPLDFKDTTGCFDSQRSLRCLLTLVNDFLTGLIVLAWCKTIFTHLVSPQITR